MRTLRVMTAWAPPPDLSPNAAQPICAGVGWMCWMRWWESEDFWSSSDVSFWFQWFCSPSSSHFLPWFVWTVQHVPQWTVVLLCFWDLLCFQPRFVTLFSQQNKWLSSHLNISLKDELGSSSTFKCSWEEAVRRRAHVYCDASAVIICLVVLMVGKVSPHCY